MKSHNMRDMQKFWAEQRRKAEEKAARLAPKKAEPAPEPPPAPAASPKEEEPAPKTSVLAKKKKAGK